MVLMVCCSGFSFECLLSVLSCLRLTAISAFVLVLPVPDVYLSSQGV